MKRPIRHSSGRVTVGDLAVDNRFGTNKVVVMLEAAVPTKGSYTTAGLTTDQALRLAQGLIEAVRVVDKAHSLDETAD